MREKTVEAMERRKHRDRVKAKAKRDERRVAKRAEQAALPRRAFTGPKLFKGPPVEMSKSELRRMFAEAIANTARMT